MGYVVGDIVGLYELLDLAVGLPEGAIVGLGVGTADVLSAVGLVDGAAVGSEVGHEVGSELGQELG